MNRDAMLSKISRLTLSILAAFAVAACSPTSEPAAKPPLEGSDIGGPFELVNKDSAPVKWEDFDGQYRIVYFGFTYCPDICPNDVSRMIRGLDRFGEDEPELAAQIQPIFISVDPERDTPEIVGEFSAAFSDDLIGLTGTPEQVKSATNTFRVFFSRGEDTPGGGYLVDHSTFVYLFGKSGEPLATLPKDEGVDAVAAELAKWVR